MVKNKKFKKCPKSALVKNSFFGVPKTLPERYRVLFAVFLQPFSQQLLTQYSSPDK